MDISTKKKLFEKQYSRLFDDIYRFTLYRMQKIKEAEDITAEIFLTAFEKLDHYHPECGSLRTWIFQIAKNKIIDFWRKRKITVDLQEIINIFEPFEEESFSKNFDYQLLVKRIFANLNPQMKILFTFRYIDGLNYEEISQLTGKKADALRKTFSRIHAKLKLQLQGFQETFTD